MPPIPDDPANLNKSGISTVPSGEPASVEEITRLCQLFAPDAARTLRAIYRNTKASSGARVTAALGVLNRAYGTVAPAQQPVAKGGDERRDLDQLSDAEIAAALKLLTRRAAVQGGDAASEH